MCKIDISQAYDKTPGFEFRSTKNTKVLANNLGAAAIDRTQAAPKQAAKSRPVFRNV